MAHESCENVKLSASTQLQIKQRDLSIDTSVSMMKH